MSDTMRLENCYQQCLTDGGVEGQKAGSAGPTRAHAVWQPPQAGSESATLGGLVDVSSKLPASRTYRRRPADSDRNSALGVAALELGAEGLRAHEATLKASNQEPTFSLGESDAVRWLRTLSADSVDLVITDPPYESLEKHRAIGTTTRLKQSKGSSNVWFDIFPNARFGELFAELYRVLKKHRHFYLFCDAETMFVAKPIAEQCGFKFWKPIVWDKQRIGMGYHYRSRYEFILFFEKGKRKLNDLGQPDIIEAARIFKGYPTEKPAKVSQVLVEQSTEPGELVIDPFMGSGSAGEAALRAKRHFLGNDLSSDAVELSRDRLSSFGTSDRALYERVKAAQQSLI